MNRVLRRVFTAGATALAIGLASFGSGAAAQAAGTGTIVVVVTDSLGAPLVGATLAVLIDGGRQFDPVGGPSDSSGRITVPVDPNTEYELQITAPGGLVDYVPGKAVPVNVGKYSAAAGETTTVTEQLSQSGNVEISTVDRVTGAPVTDACPSLSGSNSVAFDCGLPIGAGRYLYAGVPLGAHTIGAYRSVTHWEPDPVQITVSPGAVDVPIRLAPAGAIRTVVQAADNPSIHPQFCVQPVYATDTLLNNGDVYCTNDEATGSVAIGPLPSAPVQLFAFSTDYLFTNTTFAPVYGAQWVGASGGTGDQRLAQTLTVAAGSVLNLPPIRVDHSGSITGTVSGPAGAPADPAGTAQVAVMPTGPQVITQFRDGPGLGTMTRAGGSYQLAGLGPYKWPVLFQDLRGTFNEQWSGGAPNRYQASMVSVPAGGTATANASLAYAAGIGGRFTGTSGQSPTGTWVMATNALTGDLTGQASANGNTWGINGLGKDPVHLMYSFNDQIQRYPFPVTPNGLHTKSIVLVPNSWPVSSDPMSPYGAQPLAPPAQPSVRATGPAPAHPATPSAPSLATPLTTCGYARPRCV